jgi:hypothetical protein
MLGRMRIFIRVTYAPDIVFYAIRAADDIYEEVSRPTLEEIYEACRARIAYEGADPDAWPLIEFSSYRDRRPDSLVYAD